MTTISKETLEFLSLLSENNNREWFQEHKETYLKAKDNVDAFAQQVIDGFREIEPQIPGELTGKKSVMRIYRDVRFSKNKSPYKLNFAFYISLSAKGVHSPGYYVQLQPGNSFIAGGMWMPDAPHLKSIRQEIDYNGDDLLAILDSKSFKTYFKDGLSEEDKLKTTPKGYDADHPNIELLKLKSFTVSYPIKDEALYNKGIISEVINCFKEIMPLNSFLKEAIASV
ncbi:DUF2461 domain-containing protein [Pedobacter alpinus]|uniref:DUF2461 domain-containing protein n=1 Tax=Pedobacter alpinus TaxID=1590643 RepID=A0ABW5TQ26_9SPHI